MSSIMFPRRCPATKKKKNNEMRKTTSNPLLTRTDTIKADLNHGAKVTPSLFTTRCPRSQPPRTPFIFWRRCSGAEQQIRSPFTINWVTITPNKVQVQYQKQKNKHYKNTRFLLVTLSPQNDFAFDSQTFLVPLSWTRKFIQVEVI